MGYGKTCLHGNSFGGWKIGPWCFLDTRWDHNYKVEYNHSLVGLGVAVQKRSFGHYRRTCWYSCISLLGKAFLAGAFRRYDK